MAAIGGLTAIFGFAQMAINGRFDLDDRRYEIVTGIMQLLSKDMAADAEVSVSIDFRPHQPFRDFARSGPW